MTLLIAVALGALQGLTEFLPVSSSGHLRLLAELFGLAEPQIFFDILLHVGTLAAVLVVYRALVWRMILGTIRLIGAAFRGPSGVKAVWRADPDARVAMLACLATIPTGLIAIALGDIMERAAADIAVVGLALMVNAGILFTLGAIQKRRIATQGPGAGRGLDGLQPRDALIIGTIQGFAVFRGISRSGSTITTGMLTGLNQEAASSFSFVLSIPAILGAVVLKFDASALSGAQLFPALIGMVTAATVGTGALLWLLRLLRGGRLQHFAWYCLALGAIALVARFAGGGLP